MNNKVIIAAVSARPYAQAASAAGYEVITVDAFADADTRSAASQSYAVSYVQSGFEVADFEACMAKINCDEVIGFAYASGFDASADLLESVGKRIPLIGNSPKVVRNLKRPLQFFTLLSVLRIPHPEVSFKPLENASGWLYKQCGGSGGTHIRKALPLSSIGPQAGYYFQREAPGVPISLLFAADGMQIKVVGFNLQWVSPSPSMPYRYGGAVSNVSLPESVKQQLIYAAQQLTAAVGLRGLNSLDAMVNGDEVLVLEINPRLSASFDLYQSPDFNLFELHLRACARDISDWPQVPKRAKAHYIVYAPCNLELPDAAEWPDWVADIPVGGSVVAADNPLCTLLAEADKTEAAQELVMLRAKALLSLIAQ
ncbi:MAG TPA: ATP-grasp domain-containing protein [Methylophilaceae bacterium]